MPAEAEMEREEQERKKLLHLLKQLPGYQDTTQEELQEWVAGGEQNEVTEDDIIICLLYTSRCV